MIAGPAALAGRQLFEPLAPWLGLLPNDRLPTCDELNLLLAREPSCRLADGRPMRCLLPERAGPGGYEAGIRAGGGIPTRPGDWHDCFNALVWRAFPASKEAINQRHCGEIARCPGAPARGPVRDALTQFDECGVLVVSHDPALCAGLAAHRWEAVFHGRREDVVAGMAFIVFGHATYDQLRAPFQGLCAKAVYRQVAPQWFDLAPEARWREADGWLSRWFREGLMRPKDLSPLPLLGVPGLTQESEAATYYQDTGQFRPLPAGRTPAPCWGTV